MHIILSLTTADNAFGRFGAHSLPQQSLAELLVQGLADVAIAKDKGGNFIDIEEWSIFTFDDAGSITHIQMHVKGLQQILREAALGTRRHGLRTITRESFKSGGSIDLKYCPASVTHISIRRMVLDGSITTEVLPRGLTALDLTSNRFMWAFEIGGLPETAEYINISYNRFIGSLDLPALPRRMREFHANMNNFSGTIVLTRLPETLEVLRLGRNTLSGEIMASDLPKGMRYVALSANFFDGEYVTVAEGAVFHRFEIDGIFRGRVVTPSGVACAPGGLVLNDRARAPVTQDDDEAFAYAEYLRGRGEFDL